MPSGTSVASVSPSTEWDSDITFEGCCEVKRTEHVKRSAQPQAQNTHGGDYCLFSSDQFPYVLSGRELKSGSVKRSIK